MNAQRSEIATRLFGAWCIFLILGAIGAGCNSNAQPEKVIRVTRNIGGREGFRLHFEKWKAAFEAKHP
ncbi:MAG: hypothetical protein HY706_05080, partial [Candidatus Hydrogenedentes bacterium]|nr:hypothetical protein [Candidatus Hydrogenedentota bacterium]